MHFGGIFVCVKNAVLRAISLLCTCIIIFVNISLVYTLCAEFRIEYTDLHIKAVLTVHLWSAYIQWFGRESRTKLFLHLSFIYIEMFCKENKKSEITVWFLFYCGSRIRQSKIHIF